VGKETGVEEEKDTWYFICPQGWLLHYFAEGKHYDLRKYVLDIRDEVGDYSRTKVIVGSPTIWGRNGEVGVEKPYRLCPVCST